MRITKACQYPELLQKILLRYRSQRSFAKVLGENHLITNRRLTGKKVFTPLDMAIWSDLLDIPAAQWQTFFLSKDDRDTYYHQNISKQIVIRKD
jgi:hypothetical protein